MDLRFVINVSLAAVKISEQLRQVVGNADAVNVRMVLRTVLRTRMYTAYLLTHRDKLKAME